MKRQDDRGDAGAIPRRTFLAGLVTAIAAVLAAFALPAWRAERGAPEAARSVPGPRLRPLTRNDLYRDHDLAG